MSKGILFVISAPSGTGKTTLLKRVMATLGNLEFSISHTTRQPRQGEQDGRDYHFVSRERFEGMIGDGLFLEWARVHDNLYGTSIGAVESQLAGGKDVILDIDVQGASIIRESGQEAVSIFIAPPSLGVLEARLRGRKTDSEETIALRLKNARDEMAEAGSYDYFLINDQLDEAVQTLSAVIVAERSRRRRRPDGEPVQLEIGS